MNKEIKFRAWDGERFRSNFIVHSENGMAMIHRWENEFMHDWIVEQYTGIKDKNGIEIYEGDIISADRYLFIDEDQQNYVGIVEFLPPAFAYTLKCVNSDKRGVSEGAVELLGEDFDLEVIGNIHENPELLEHIR